MTSEISFQFLECWDWVHHDDAFDDRNGDDSILFYNDTDISFLLISVRPPEHSLPVPSPKYPLQQKVTLNSAFSCLHHS